MILYDFCEIHQSSFFIKHLWTVASDLDKNLTTFTIIFNFQKIFEILVHEAISKSI